ncbi:hypothetical protein K443DRAFT_463203 [Laccaria amethystina LaAM-08-1]|uniref:Uncharacterized protein n=1 Tax=Laccaria amethystina LaAM-08-1 TaxID=1095629 RepID=A0A0C9WHY4_9AGAR|nr:hypothetical protein K443DRAFT_463203 [Laccaria amethystina LaAM-08-1]
MTVLLGCRLGIPCEFHETFTDSTKVGGIVSNCKSVATENGRGAKTSTYHCHKDGNSKPLAHSKPNHAIVTEPTQEKASGGECSGR